jgi:chemotaxis response regulator CheB
LASAIFPILITQHITKILSTAFSERLDRWLAMAVFEPQEGLALKWGAILSKHYTNAEYKLEYN